MRASSHQKIIWICIAGLTFLAAFLVPTRPASSDVFGGDVVVLTELVAKAIEQIEELHQIISKTSETANLLEEMNRGVKEVLRLADTAHLALPPQVYAQARTLSGATAESHRIYGNPPDGSAPVARTHYQSGTEALFLSQDAFEYSTELDRSGDHVKQSAVSANPQSAARLTAETLGVVLHAISHTNRLQAKSLEISATDRLEKSQKDAAQWESFSKTQDSLEKGFREYDPSDLPPISSEYGDGDGPIPGGPGGSVTP